MLDVTSVVMGPLATQILGDLGADVITVEPPGGEVTRKMSAGGHDELSGVAMNLLRNKRNVGIDLAHPDGRQIFGRLVEGADVMVTNLRESSLERLGLTYDDVRAIRPDIVFCQATGYASDSPGRDAPAYDDIVQAASGICDLYVRRDGEPALLPTVVADKVSALTIVYSLLAALFHRERTGEGQRVEVPMVDVMRAFVLVEHAAAAVPEPALGPPGYPRILTRQRRPQRTADGWIQVLPYGRRNYESLFRVGGREDLIGDERTRSGPARVANAESLYRDVAEIVATRTTDEWMEICGAEGIPAARLATLDEIVDELPVVGHPVAGDYREIVPPVRFSATPASVRRPAPLPGQHNHEVLAEAGLDESEIARLESAGVVWARPEVGECSSKP